MTHHFFFQTIRVNEIHPINLRKKLKAPLGRFLVGPGTWAGLPSPIAPDLISFLKFLIFLLIPFYVFFEMIFKIMF